MKRLRNIWRMELFQGPPKWVPILGELQKTLQKGEYLPLRPLPMFESNFFQVTHRGSPVYLHHGSNRLTMGVAATLPDLVLPNILLIAKPPEGKDSSNLILTRMIPLDLVHLYVHDLAAWRLKLRLATGRYYYLELDAPDYEVGFLFDRWIRLINLLREPATSWASRTLHTGPPVDLSRSAPFASTWRLQVGLYVHRPLDRSQTKRSVSMAKSVFPYKRMLLQKQRKAKALKRKFKSQAVGDSMPLIWSQMESYDSRKSFPEDRLLLSSPEKPTLTIRTIFSIVSSTVNQKETSKAQSSESGRVTVCGCLMKTPSRCMSENNPDDFSSMVSYNQLDHYLWPQDIKDLMDTTSTTLSSSSLSPTTHTTTFYHCTPYPSVPRHNVKARPPASQKALSVPVPSGKTPFMLDQSQKAAAVPKKTLAGPAASHKVITAPTISHKSTAKAAHSQKTPVVQVLSKKIPSVTAPSQRAPVVSVPSKKVPPAPVSSQKAPRVPVPSKKIPPVPSQKALPATVPSQKTPIVSVPSKKVPPAPIPSQKVPHAPVPSQKVPSVTAPSKKAPGVSVPSKKVPPASVPPQKAPHVPVPSQKVPPVTIPTQKVRPAPIPSQKVPHAPVPSQKVPSVIVPTQKFPPVPIPSQKVPHAPVPSQKLPTVTVPSQKAPGISIPSKRVSHVPPQKTLADPVIVQKATSPTAPNRKSFFLPTPSQKALTSPTQYQRTFSPPTSLEKTLADSRWPAVSQGANMLKSTQPEARREPVGIVGAQETNVVEQRTQTRSLELPYGTAKKMSEEVLVSKTRAMTLEGLKGVRKSEDKVSKEEKEITVDLPGFRSKEIQQQKRRVKTKELSLQAPTLESNRPFSVEGLALAKLMIMASSQEHHSHTAVMTLPSWLSLNAEKPSVSPNNSQLSWLQKSPVVVREQPESATWVKERTQHWMKVEEPPWSSEDHSKVSLRSLPASNSPSVETGPRPPIPLPATRWEDLPQSSIPLPSSRMEASARMPQQTVKLSQVPIRMPNQQPLAMMGSSSDILLPMALEIENMRDTTTQVEVIKENLGNLPTIAAPPFFIMAGSSDQYAESKGGIARSPDAAHPYSPRSRRWLQAEAGEGGGWGNRPRRSRNLMAPIGWDPGGSSQLGLGMVLFCTPPLKSERNSGSRHNSTQWGRLTSVW
ncbi:PREDICTED: putative protein FAM71E2 [Chrysochloris asiatica]|uniref:Golgi associated RAB2 interactor protein-like Rab2B-binding domain-containing protein n=1 Tax=Chrysochloris asiatica TaxID=185453 RepID=A0A9B0TX94_CHRAS|nr:PREDICTED: putative protein FAM71E2 [Chrysochloris asiatica]